MKATIGTLCGGFGGVDIGAMQAGLEPAWSIEYDATIAEVAAANLNHKIHVRNILDCDPLDFDAADILHASPPCPNFSVASTGASETELDIALARKTAEFVTKLQPRIFTLENVIAYRHSKSWRIIENALNMAGYWLNVAHVNAADMGVPQTRKRMIVRAVLGGFVPYLPEPVPWVGWYAAVEDILHTLPESQFANWQLARLPELLATTLVANGGFHGEVVRVGTHEPAFTITANMMGRTRAFLINGGGNTNFAEAYPGRGCRYADEPSHTVTTVTEGGGAMPKAWLINSENAGQEWGGTRWDDKPAMTLTSKSKPRAWLVDGANTTDGQLSIRESGQPALTVTTGGTKHPLRSLLHTGRVVAMTPRALARFQSFPDWYELPDNARLAAKGIGNAVPPLLYQRIIEPLLEVL